MELIQRFIDAGLALRFKTRPEGGDRTSIRRSEISARNPGELRQIFLNLLALVRRRVGKDG